MRAEEEDAMFKAVADTQVVLDACRPGRRWQRPFLRLGLTLALAFTGAVALAQSVTVLTHSSFDLPAELIDEFTATTGIEVDFLIGGDAGEVVNRAILTKARPLADLLFGVDDNLLERARAEAIFEPYLSPELERVAPELWLDVHGLVTPIDVGFVVPNFDVGWFAERGLEALLGPTTESGELLSLADLATAPYVGLSAIIDPASSSPGLAFMLATIVRFGDPAAGIPASVTSEYGDWLEFWAALRDNDLTITEGWTDAYYTQFSHYGGDRPIVLSYATSPAAEVIFAEEELDQSPTANLQCRGCAYRQVEGIGILAGTDEPAAARAFIDFLLSREVQEAIPLAMFVAPVVSDAAVPPEFGRYATLDDGVVAESLPAATVRANQQRWLAQWTAVVRQGREPANVR